jgi:HEPN domain-containing protein
LPRKTDSSNPADWIFIAESDLVGIRELARAELSFYLCQSKLAEVLEKVLKAELTRLGWELIKTHDVQELAKELKARNAVLSATIEPLSDALADCYFISRYPGFDMPEPDWSELRQLIEQVADVLVTVKSNIPGPQ